MDSNETIVLLICVTLMAGCLGGQTEDGDSTDLADIGNNTVIYNSSGFFPRTVTVETGETVTWQSTGPSMWVASDQHPTHTEYSGTSTSEHCGAPATASDRFDACEDTQEYTFTFDRSGEWGYHNHLLSSHTGTVVVE